MRLFNTVKKTRLKQQLYKFAAVLFAICITAIAASYVMTSYLFENSRKMLDSQESLSDFYGNIYSMDIVARNFIYSGSQEEHREYKRYMASARANLQTVAHNLPDIAWRISLLGNMLDTYDAYFESHTDDDRRNVYYTYENMRYLRNLISNTSLNYYQLLAAGMREQTALLQKRWVSLQIIMLAGVCLITAGSIIAAARYIKSIIDPITAMINNIIRIRDGNYEVISAASNFVEFDILSGAVSEMAHAVEQNVQHIRRNAILETRVLEQENDNLAIKNLLAKEKIKSLQLQINPHFLFNTLSLISNRAYISGDSETNELIGSLSEVLRYALDKTSKISSIHEEILCIRNYLNIQRRRFFGRIRFVTDICENLHNIPIPAVILQPLVENAIIHGVAEMTEGVEVTLKIHIFDRYLQIHVEDNGCGIKPEELEEITARLQLDPIQSADDEDSGIGLQNVYRRLAMFFGKDMGFSIQSEPGCGTVITLELPLD